MFTQKNIFFIAWAKKLGKFTQIMCKLHKSWSMSWPHWPSIKLQITCTHVLPMVIPSLYPLLVCYLHFFLRCPVAVDLYLKKYKNWDLWQVRKMWWVWNAICDWYFMSDLLLYAQICVNKICVNTICKLRYSYMHNCLHVFYTFIN